MAPASMTITFTAGRRDSGEDGLFCPHILLDLSDRPEGAAHKGVATPDVSEKRPTIAVIVTMKRFMASCQSQPLFGRDVAKAFAISMPELLAGIEKQAEPAKRPQTPRATEKG